MLQGEKDQFELSSLASVAWWFYEPDIQIPPQHWNMFVEAFMLNANDNGPESLSPVAA